MPLADLKFTDLYLGGSASWMTGTPGHAGNPSPAPPELAEALEDLRKACAVEQEKTARNEFSIVHHGVAYRVSCLPSQRELVYVLRRAPATVPRLDSLGLGTGQYAELMAPELTGLIIVAGAFGQGKTTTASALVASRLEAHGGVAVTVEDPPEMPLEGQWGRGVCYQTRGEQGQFAQACRHVARWAPNLLFIGEVRDQEPAVEALRAAINGSLVICTLHADSATSAVERMYTLASNGNSGDGGNDVASLLAQGLAVVMHQALIGRPAKLKSAMLTLRGEDGSGVRSIIKSRRFDQLGSAQDQQRNRMLHRGRADGGQ